MRYHALVCGWDRTVAGNGVIDREVEHALRRVLASGRHVVLVTRHSVETVLRTLPGNLFAWVVAEGGAVLHDPTTGVDQSIPGPDADARAGVTAALGAMGLSPHNAVAITRDDAHLGVLELAELGAAVAAAPGAVRDRADVVVGDGQPGVVELADRLVADDLGSLEPALVRRHLLLGDRDGTEVSVAATGPTLLLAGASGTGKSTLARGLLDRLAEQGYQFCVLDPEGDHADLPDVVHLGDRYSAPTPDDVIAALQSPGQRVVVNLLGQRLADLPQFLQTLLRRVQELRARTGRPHWLVLDEANHFLPLPGERNAFAVPRWLDGLLMACVNPEHIAPSALGLVDVVVSFGDGADDTLARFSAAIGETGPTREQVDLAPGDALAWFRREGDRLERFTVAGGDSVRQPHLRRWGEAPLVDQQQFRFTGPDGRLDLPAATLADFVLLARGVDDETWCHHLRRDEYSAWFREAVHDPDLAAAATAAEGADGASAADSRARIIDAIVSRYQPS